MIERTPNFIKLIYKHLKEFNYRYEIYAPYKKIGNISFKTYEIFKRYTEHDKMLHLMLEMCADNSTFYDIGAFVGKYSIALAKAFSKSYVYSFEPNPYAIKRLRKNISCNKLSNRIIVHNIGISNKKHKIPFYVASNFNRSSFNRFYVENINEKIIDIIYVPIISIDEIIEHKMAPVPDFIKIDVEGHGKEVLTGAIQTIKKHKPIIFLEPHHIYKANKEGKIIKINRNELLKPILKNLNYKIIEYGYPWVCRPL